MASAILLALKESRWSNRQTRPARLSNRCFDSLEFALPNRPRTFPLQVSGKQDIIGSWRRNSAVFFVSTQFHRSEQSVMPPASSRCACTRNYCYVYRRYEETEKGRKRKRSPGRRSDTRGLHIDSTDSTSNVCSSFEEIPVCRKSSDFSVIATFIET